MKNSLFFIANFYIMKFGFEAVLDDHQFQIMEANFEPDSFQIKKGTHRIRVIQNFTQVSFLVASDK
jgi:hypothetical protein